MTSESFGLRSLDQQKTVWYLPEQPVVEDVIIPALRNTESFDCMVGYFGCGALKQLAPGLASFVTGTSAPVRLLVSPVISQAEQRAISEGLHKPEEVLEFALGDILESEEVLESALANHTLECLSFLLARNRLQIRVVLIRDAIFHLKEWLFKNGEDHVLLSGSANFTGQALTKNVEKLNLYKSWKSPESADACFAAIEQFTEYWENRKQDALSIDLPIAIREKLVSTYLKDSPPTEEDFQRALRAEQPAAHSSPGGLTHIDRGTKFSIPADLVWETGKYKHQGEAVHAWESAGRRGVLVMATGAGKTISALVAAWRLAEEVENLLILIAAPSRPLVEQWKSVARKFGLEPYAVTTHTRVRRLKEVEDRLLNLELGVSDYECIVVTLDFATDPEFLKSLKQHNGPVMLIADEVHNFGTDAFMAVAPESVGYRLGLSATPDRYDESQTAQLHQYFGETVFEFGLEKAIGVCLVPYDYYLMPVKLDEAEMEEYQRWTDKIFDCLREIKKTDSPENRERLQQLTNRRRLVLESAQEKIEVLGHILDDIGPSELKYALFYATDKDPTQLREVNQMLDEKKILYHQVTAEETTNTSLVESTLALFQQGKLQALTAKRVLDEGLDIPEITTAFILASTTMKRQWVQRRGRVLRMSTRTNKVKAVIYDFLVLPPVPEPRDSVARRMIQSELERCDEFASLALNRAAANGPLEVLNDVRLSYFVGEQQ